MPLVSDDDVQVHLPIDKLKVEEVPDSLTQVYLDVERVIRGALSNTFSPSTLASWLTPNATPKYIRAIGGRLAAALIYATRLAQDDSEGSVYAQGKYNEAMLMLQSVVDGTVVLEEVDEEVDSAGRLSVGHFSQNPDPKFTMDSVF